LGASKQKLKAKEREEYRKMLLARRALLLGDVNNMHDSALNKSATSTNGDLSRVPYHMADVGTDNFEHEFTLGLIENEEEELREIDAALDRIANATFGLCKTCGKPIPKARLKIIPYTKYCIECKRDEENGNGS